ncbi:MAG: protease modulator HflC [Pseudomonadota bacterium]|nr:protease modulator HflC [Pseudomonadota bacterium]
MSGKQIIFAILAGVIFLLTINTFFSVHETKQAIVLQFGRPVGAPITDSGLKIKIPFIQQVQYLDKRVLDLDSPAEEVIASDQKRLVVDSITRWKISDPLQFYISVRDERLARSRLQAIVSSSLRSVLGGEEFVTVVRDNRDELMKRITARVNEQSVDLGISIVDVRIKRADLPDANSQAIYRRMQTERQQEAAEFRAKGQEISRGIRAEAEKKVTVLLAEATRDSEVIRGTGDACRNRIFASAYGLDPDFFAFYRSMKSYEEALGEGTTIVLSPDSDFLKFLSNPNAISNESIDKGNELTPENRKLINLIKTNERLRNIICPELTQVKQ